MSWSKILKLGYRGDYGRRTFDNFEQARKLAFNWSFTLPHVVRRKDGKFTVMMKKDTYGQPEAEYGPIIWEERGRR